MHWSSAECDFTVSFSCRNKETNESRGFAFLAYEDQRSTDIAVDNLNGFTIDGRVIAVDHVKDYKRLVDNPDAVHNQQQGNAAPQAQAQATQQALPAGYSAAAPAQDAASHEDENGAGPSDQTGGAAGGSSLADMLAEVEEGLADKARSWRERRNEGERRGHSGNGELHRGDEDPMAAFGHDRKVKKHKREKGEKHKRDKGEKKHAHRDEKHRRRAADADDDRRSHKHARRSRERSP